MQSLAAAVAQSPLPAQPFRDLIQANRQDQEVTRYETFDQLLGYCRLSAAPVGELVLHVFGAATPDRLAQSERICAGLQVIEHIQDVAEDYSRGRIYMPARGHGAVRMLRERDGRGTGRPELRALLAFEAQRAGSLLDQGAPLATTLSARPRAALAGFVAGGRAALHALASGVIRCLPISDPDRYPPSLRQSVLQSGTGQMIRRSAREMNTSQPQGVRGPVSHEDDAGNRSRAGATESCEQITRA